MKQFDTKYVREMSPYTWIRNQAMTPRLSDALYFDFSKYSLIQTNLEHTEFRE